MNTEHARDGYPLAVLLELRERELEERRLALGQAEAEVAAASTLAWQTHQSVERDAQALDAHQIELDQHRKAGFTVADSLRFEAEEDALRDALEATRLQHQQAEARHREARERLGRLRAEIELLIGQLEATRQHRALWRQRRRQALESAEHAEIEQLFAHRRTSREEP